MRGLISLGVSRHRQRTEKVWLGHAKSAATDKERVQWAMPRVPLLRHKRLCKLVETFASQPLRESLSVERRVLRQKLMRTALLVVSDLVNATIACGKCGLLEFARQHSEFTS